MRGEMSCDCGKRPEASGFRFHRAEALAALAIPHRKRASHSTALRHWHARSHEASMMA